MMRLLVVKELFRIQHGPEHILDRLMSVGSGGGEGGGHQSFFFGGWKAGERAEIDFIGDFIVRP